AENVAAEFKIGRLDQDAYALRSQQRYAKARAEGFFSSEIVPVMLASKKGDPTAVREDEHPRETSLDALAKLKPIVRDDGTVTAGNDSGVNGRARAGGRGSGGGRKAAGPGAEGARARHGNRRRAAAHHGYRAGSGDAQSPGEDRPQAFRHRRHRVER